MRSIIFSALFLLALPLALEAQTVDILWQGNNYVSPFYKGLPLWSKQSEITFVAIPHGLGDPASLNYVWSRNGTVLGLVSGTGRNTLTFVDSVLSKPVNIKIEILASGERLLAENSLTVAPVEPAVEVYENHPLYGFIFHREVSENYQMEGEEVTFTGFPFFFSAFDKATPGLTYRWGTRSGESTGPSVTYRTPEDGGGSALVSLELSHQGFLTQKASRQFMIQFGTP